MLEWELKWEAVKKKRLEWELEAETITRSLPKASGRKLVEWRNSPSNLFSVEVKAAYWTLHYDQR